MGGKEEIRNAHGVFNFFEKRGWGPLLSEFWLLGEIVGQKKLHRNQHSWQNHCDIVDKVRHSWQNHCEMKHYVQYTIRSRMECYFIPLRYRSMGAERYTEWPSAECAIVIETAEQLETCEQLTVDCWALWSAIVSQRGFLPGSVS